MVLELSQTSVGLRPFHLCPLIKPESLLGHRAGQSSGFFQFLRQEAGRGGERELGQWIYFSLSLGIAAGGWLISGLEDELAQVR